MEIYMSIADRFMAAFKGSDLAHGQTTIGNKRRNGKTEAKSFIVKQPLTKEISLFIQTHFTTRSQ